MPASEKSTTAGGLPPGFTTEPVALGASKGDFPSTEVAPGEYGEATPPPAPRHAATAQAPPASKPPSRPLVAPPSAQKAPDAFATAALRAEARAFETVAPPRAPGAIVDPSAAPDMGSIPGLELTEPYWLGTLPGAPVQNIDVVGVNFPLFTESVSVVAGETQRLRHNGGVVNLSERQVQAVIAGLRRKVIRWKDAQRRRGYLVTIPSEAEAARQRTRGHGRSFRPMPGDEPAGCYVYLVKGGRTSENLFPASIVPRVQRIPAPE